MKYKKKDNKAIISKTQKGLVYDCFTFFNELEMLEVRLNTLNDVVDKFVLVEATRTQNNKKKPLYYKKNKAKYKEFAHKIIHITVDKFPKKISQWTIENYQRNAIKKGLRKCNDNDIIIFSDLDEIINPDLIEKYKSYLKQGIITVFKLNSFFLNLNLWYPDLVVDNRAKMLYYKDFKNGILNKEKEVYKHCALDLNLKENRKTSFSKIRLYNGKKQRFINNAGWHFSWLGDKKKTLKKFKAVCEGRKEALMEDAIKHRNYLFSKLKPVFINQYFPEYIRINQERYKHLIAKPKYTFSPFTIMFYRIRRKIYKCVLMMICWIVPTKQLRYKVRHILD